MHMRSMYRVLCLGVHRIYVFLGFIPHWFWSLGELSGAVVASRQGGAVWELFPAQVSSLGYDLGCL